MSADMLGEALVPYYRQILPVFNIFKNFNTNIGDRIDYHQQKDEDRTGLFSAWDTRVRKCCSEEGTNCRAPNYARVSIQ